MDDDPFDDFDWDGAGDDLESLAEEEIYPALFGAAYTDAASLLPGDISFDLHNPQVQKTIGKLAKQIRGVVDTTRDEVAALAVRATEEGLSMRDLAKQIDALGEINAPRRAMMIARTESATAYNLGSLLAYDEGGVGEVTVLDGDDDPDCQAADGQTWTLDEARDNPIAHPNCVRSFAPKVT